MIETSFTLFYLRKAAQLVPVIFQLYRRRFLKVKPFGNTISRDLHESAEKKIDKKSNFFRNFANPYPENLIFFEKIFFKHFLKKFTLTFASDLIKFCIKFSHLLFRYSRERAHKLGSWSWSCAAILRAQSAPNLRLFSLREREKR